MKAQRKGQNKERRGEERKNRESQRVDVEREREGLEGSGVLFESERRKRQTLSMLMRRESSRKTISGTSGMARPKPSSNSPGGMLADCLIWETAWATVMEGVMRSEKESWLPAGARPGSMTIVTVFLWDISCWVLFVVVAESVPFFFFFFLCRRPELVGRAC